MRQNFTNFRRKNTLARVKYSREEFIAFDTCGLFCNVPYKKVHTTQTTALSRSSKKTATAVGVSVSKLYVTLCGAAAKLRVRVTVCWGS